MTVNCCNLASRSLASCPATLLKSAPESSPLHLQALGDQVCNDPLAAGPLLRDAVQAGGEQAQLWTYALLNLGPNCPDPSALSMAYSVAIGGINDGTTDSLDATTE